MQRLVTIPLRAVGRPGEVLWKGGWPIAIQRPLSCFLNGFEIVVEALFTNKPVACCGEGKADRAGRLRSMLYHRSLGRDLHKLVIAVVDAERAASTLTRARLEPSARWRRPLPTSSSPR